MRILVPSRIIDFLAVHHVWFARRPERWDAFRFSQYYHCQSLDPVWGFRRRPKFTLLVDLRLPENQLLAGFSETTRQEVRRAERDSVRTGLETDIQRYCDFAQVPISGLRPYWQTLQITKAMVGNEVLVMHSYIFDAKTRRAALYHSASGYKLEPSSQKRNLIGRANRWLHFQDMLMFKRRGAIVYDLGGFAPDSDDPKLRRINDFKGGFGGSLVEESNYVSYPVIWWNGLVRGRKVTT